MFGYAIIITFSHNTFIFKKNAFWEQKPCSFVFVCMLFLFTTLYSCCCYLSILTTKTQNIETERRRNIHISSLKSVRSRRKKYLLQYASQKALASLPQDQALYSPWLHFHRALMRRIKPTRTIEKLIQIFLWSMEDSIRSLSFGWQEQSQLR